MNASSLPHLRIAFVATRDLTQRNGRTLIQGHLLRALRRHHRVDVLQLASLLQTRRPADLLGAGLTWLVSLARGRPLPLQCLLYGARSEAHRLAAEIRDSNVDAVYLDTVRCQILLRQLRRLCPDVHVVSDFDDLMSRRAEFLARHRLPFLSGHVGPHFPRWLRALAEGPLARLITAYEAATLPAAEREVSANSDLTVLLSPVERRLLETRTQGPVISIPPGVSTETTAWRGSEGLRFIFIGSDRQLQNRTAIDRLLTLWSTIRPAAPLHIYGHQGRPAASLPGIEWHGFVEDLAEVYQPGSIALAPSTVAGGIKTKVIEAWSWGCPVLATPLALEGIGLESYPLALPEEQWAPSLRDPALYGERWAQAARLGNDFVRDILTPARFEAAWEQAMVPSPAAASLPGLLG
jgi:glycosyltransferase involved in cell wall biosynthesis